MTVATEEGEDRVAALVQFRVEGSPAAGGAQGGRADTHARVSGKKWKRWKILRLMKNQSPPTRPANSITCWWPTRDA